MQPMTREQIEAEVVEVLTTILRTEATPNASRVDTPQWDSLKHIEFMFALEEALNLQFSEAELSSLDSIEAIVDAVMRRHAA